MVEYICGREDGEVTGKGGWKRWRWGWAQITKGPAHYIREYGLYPESTWKLLKDFSQLNDVIIVEL